MARPMHPDNSVGANKFKQHGLLSSAMVLVMGVLLAGIMACAPVSTTGQPTAAPAAESTTAPTAAGGGQFVLIDGNDAVTLDPHASPDVGYTYNLLRGPFESLVEYTVKPDGTVDIVPLLAKEWKTEDAITWDFDLNPGITFTDGTPLDAAAVKWNFDRILGMNLGPAGRLGAVESVEALDEDTVRITLPGPNADFLNYLSMMLMISPKSIQDQEQNGDWAQEWAADNLAAGTGPFIVKSRSKGSETIMERNPDYWRGWDGNHVDSVVVKVVKEPATRYLLMDRGEAHVAIGIALTDIPNLEKNADVVVEQAGAPGTGLGMFRFRGPLEDVNVRKALVWAFDSEGFVKSAMRGLADPPQGMLQPSFRFFNPDMPLIKQDMEKAKEYLKQSAYPDGGFTLSLMILPAFAAYHPAMAQIWQENLKELNITLDIKPMTDLATYYASMEDNENGDDMWAWSGQAQTPDHNFQARRQWHSEFTRPRGVNGGYSNPELDALLEEDLQTLDADRRKEIWYRVQEILVEDMPSIPFATNHTFWVRRANVEGAPYNVFNLVPNYYNISLSQ